jgi:hypothetical protein
MLIHGSFFVADIIIGYNSSAPLYISIASLFLAQLPQLILSTVNVVYAGKP